MSRFESNFALSLICPSGLCVVDWEYKFNRPVVLRLEVYEDSEDWVTMMDCNLEFPSTAYKLLQIHLLVPDTIANATILGKDLIQCYNLFFICYTTLQ